jgi:hemolysin III
VTAFTLQESTGTAESALVAPVNLVDGGALLAPEVPTYGRTAADELVNTVTHGFGFMLAVAGAQAMAARLMRHADRMLEAGCVMYLFSLVAVYAMSTLSHGVTSPKWKSRFRALDQGFIYLLIVGTYTPYALAYLHGPMWNALLCGMWAVALVGFTAKVFFAHRVESVSVMAPLMLGWIPIVAVPTLMRTAPSGAFDMIMSGGICYTAGTLFLIYDERVRHFHALWHLCVIAGSTCHFCGLLNFVVR